MGEADRPRRPPQDGGALLGGVVKMKAGGTMFRACDLNVGPSNAVTPYSCAQGFGACFFSGKTRRQ